MTSRPTIMAFLIAGATTLNCAAADPAPYSLLDAKGKPATANARCASIQSSDLTWELKTDDGSVHDKDNTYRWGGIGAEKTGTIFFDDWNTLLTAANAEKLCGFDNWRVPTINELKTLVTNSEKNPAMNSGILSLMLQTPYWSVSTYEHYPEHAQTVDFASGTSNYYNGFRGDRLPVILVRSEIASDN